MFKINFVIKLLTFSDFSQTSKKLGELWATVPYNEKYVSYILNTRTSKKYNYSAAMFFVLINSLNYFRKKLFQLLFYSYEKTLYFDLNMFGKQQVTLFLS